MDRVIVYPGAIPLDTDILNTQRSTMIALGYMAQATFGSALTVADGLACTQTGPASMNVNVGPGSIIGLAQIDYLDFGSIPADASPLVKMGINTGTTQFALTAPVTSGKSINYLIQASLLEVDGTAIVLPYYNAANPAVPYSGPSGSGTPQNTKRTQTVQLQLKAGTAATTGTQVTPTIDVGWVGLYVVTVAFGATTVINGNISTLPGAPFIQFKLPFLTPGFSRSVSFGPGGSGGGTGTTSWTVPAGVTKVHVKCWGGGGGGGGSQASPSAASAGGAGAYSEGVYTVTPGAVISVTAGVSGSLGAAGGSNNGTSGGTSSFGAFCSSTGGAFGTGAATSTFQSAVGVFGVASGGNVLNINGTNGQAGVSLGSIGLGGGGGNAFCGSGSPPNTVTATSASAVAGGGGGGANGGAGGAGGAGIVIVEY